MTELDEEIGPIAYELIQEYGKTIIYTIVGVSVYDIATGTSAANENSKIIKAVIENANGIYKNGELIEKADKKIIISRQAFIEAFGNNIKPTPSDKFIVDNVVHTVGNNGVKSIYSGELIAVYQIIGAM